MWRLLLLLTFFFIVMQVQSQSLDSMKRLYSDLFSNYTKAVIPTSDQNNTLYVGIKAFLSAVVNFKEIEETIVITISLQFNWTDSSFIWNPADYSNMYQQFIYSTDMWTPPVMLINSVYEMKTFGGDNDFIAYVMSTGLVVYSPGDVLESKCPTDVSKFPFDSQKCSIMIMAWGLPKSVLSLQSLSNEADLEYYTEHADWQLKEYKTYTVISGQSSVFYLDLTLKRAPLYYSVMVIIPTFAFAVLNPMVFLLPTKSGDRMGFSMTILLSYAIFLTLVSASIPASSNPMCALLIVMVVIIVISGIIVFGVVLSLRYYHEEDINKISSLVKRIVKWRLKKQKNSVNYVDDDIKQKINGRDVAEMLDSVFFTGSYIAIVIIGFSYFLFVLT